MATDLTEVSQWDANVPVPDNGDAVNGPGLVNMSQPLANRLQFLRTLLNTDLQIKAIVTAQGTGAATVKQSDTAPSGGNVQITGSDIVLPAAAVGDLIIAYSQFEFSLSAGSVGDVMTGFHTIQRQSASEPIDIMGGDNAVQPLTLAATQTGLWVDSKTTSLWSFEVAAFAEAYTLTHWFNAGIIGNDTLQVANRWQTAGILLGGAAIP